MIKLILAVLYIFFGTALIGKVLARGFPLTGSAEVVGELFFVIRQDFSDLELSFGNQTPEQARAIASLLCFTTSHKT